MAPVAISRRLSNAVRNYREKKELHDQLLQDGPIPEEKITALKAEKRACYIIL